MTSGGQSFGDPGSSTRTATVVLDANVGSYSAQMGQAAQQTNLLSGAVDNLQHRLSGLDKWAGKKLFRFAAADTAILGTAAADAATFEKQLSTLAATAAVTGKSMSGVKAGIESAFVKFPASRGEVIALVEALTNLGVTGERELGKLTTTFLKLGAATGESTTGLASGLIQLSRLMGATTANQIGNFGNSLLVASKNAGVSATGVLQFAQSIAPLAKQAGIGEGAIIGISTAFNKAGADGYVAQNVFNSLVSDITQLTKTGSPELAKYANLIGMTVGQFKNLPGQEKIQKLFGAISKGDSQSLAFLNSQGFSTRQQSAIAAVTQSGGMDKAIQDAVGAQGNQKALSRGSAAATAGFADSLARLRNEFTQLGTIIGTTFLKPLTIATNSMGHMVGFITGALKPMSMLIGAFGAAGAVLGGLGSIAISAASAIGSIALLNMLRKGGPMTALRAGSAFERTGLSKDPMLLRSQEGYNAGTLSRTQTAMFRMGSGWGRMMGYARGDQESLPIRNMALAAPFRAVRWLNTGQANLLRESTMGYWDRVRRRDEQPRVGVRQRFNTFANEVRGKSAQDLMVSETKGMAGNVGGLVGANIYTGASQASAAARLAIRMFGPSIATTMIGGMLGVPHAGMAMSGAQKAAGPTNLEEASRNAGGALRTFGRNAALVLRNPAAASTVFAKSGWEATKALTTFSVKLAQAGVGLGATKLWQATTMAASGAMTGLRAVGRVVANPWTLIGGAAAMFAVNKFDRNRDNGTIGTQFTNPIQKYNDLLGTTTSNLANFNTALVEAKGGVATTTKQSMKTEETVTTADVTGAPKHATTQAFGDITKYGSDKRKAKYLLAALSAMPITDSTQLHAAKEDMLATGASQDLVQQVMTQYGKRGGPGAFSGLAATIEDYRSLGKSVREGQGIDYSDYLPGGLVGGNSASKSGKRTLSLLESGIDSQRITDEQRVGGIYARQKAVQSYSAGLGHLASMAGGAKGHQAMRPSQDALAGALSNITGGSKEKYGAYIKSHADEAKADPEQFVANALGQTTEGKRYMAPLKGAGTTKVGGMDAAIARLAAVTDPNSFNGLLARQGGSLGRFAVADKAVQASAANAGSPGAGREAVESLLAESKKLGGGFTGAVGELMKFQGAIGDSSNALYQQASAAQALAEQRQSAEAPFQTRAQNFHTAVENYQQGSTAYYATPIERRTPEMTTKLGEQKTAYQTALGEQQSYLQSMYQTAQSYGTQMKRGAEDEDLQISHARRDFFTQMSNMNEDYLKERKRTQQDYDRQLINQAETTAQSIYDPLQRVQAKYTIDSGTMLMNLQNQNQRLSLQQGELGQLHRKGLSTQAIQELNLGDASNSQQVSNLLGTATPAQLRAISAEVAKRMAATTTLTQSSYNLAFVQSQQAFNTQLGRTAADYKTTIDRASKQQQVALADMATAYGNTVRRAGEDLTTSMTEVTGTFGSMYDKTMAQIAASVQRFSPKAAAQMRSDLSALVAQFPFLMGKEAAAYDPHHTTTTPLTRGVNSSGQYGYYDKYGTFHKQYGPVPLTAPSIAPPAHPTAKPAPAPPKVPAGGIPGVTKPGLIGVPQAEGGITFGPQLSMVSEWSQNAAELHVPLNRGEQYMTGLAGVIARAVLMEMHTAGRGVSGQGTGNTIMNLSEDHSTNFTGPIKVEASDPAELARKLAAKAKLARLSSPVRRH